MRYWPMPNCLYQVCTEKQLPMERVVGRKERSAGRARSVLVGGSREIALSSPGQQRPEEAIQEREQAKHAKKDTAALIVLLKQLWVVVIIRRVLLWVLIISVIVC